MYSLTSPTDTTIAERLYTKLGAALSNELAGDHWNDRKGFKRMLNVYCVI